VALSFRSEFVNIGAEGQFFIGALFTSLIALYLGETSAMVVIPLMVIAGFIGGGLWALIPGVFKVKFKANEAIVTMLMNSIAFLLVSYLVHGPIREKGYDYPQTAPFSPSSYLPRLMPGMRIHAGIFIPFVCAVIVYVLLNKTIFGYRIRAVHAEKAAEYGGINVAKNIIYGTVLGGGLAGLAGFVEVAGLFHRLRLDVSPGYGYMAIAVAFLGNLHPLWIIPSSFLFAALIEGADQMRRVTGVPIPIVTILQGLTMMFVLVGAYLSRRRR
jgi:simple sugar transport system permease protein